MGSVLTLRTCCCCEVLNLLLGWVLAQSAEDVPERLLRDRLRTALVKQGERLLGLCKHRKQRVESAGERRGWVGVLSEGCC